MDAEENARLEQRARKVHDACDLDEAGRVYRVTAGMLPDIESLVGAGWAEWCGEDGFRARGGGSLADRADAERARREDED